MEAPIGKKSSKTTSTSQPWSPAQPLLLGAGQDLTNTYNQNQPMLNNLSSQMAGYAGQLGQQAFAPQPGLTQGTNYITNLLSQNPANNPYTDSLVHQGEQDAANQVDSTFGSAGRTGSNANQLALAKGVAMAGDQIRANQYNTGIAQQEQALGMLPSMTAAQYSGVAPYAALTEGAGQLPYYGSSALGALGGLYGGYGKTTGTQPGGWGTDLLAAGMSALPFIPGISDRRLKRDIERIGEAKDGLGIYTFSYNFDPDRVIYRGVMADEVQKLRPWAFVPNIRDGYSGVNYAALGSVE
jgi:hypothetical protein